MTDPSTTPRRAPGVAPRSDRAATDASPRPSDAPTDEPHAPWLAAFAVLAAIAFAAWAIGSLLGAGDEPAADVGGPWTIAGVAMGLVAVTCGVIGLAIEMRRSVARRRQGDGADRARPRSARRAPKGHPAHPKGASRSPRGRERTGSA